MNTDDVILGINLLLETNLRRELQITSQPKTGFVEEDYEADLKLPIFHSF